MKLAVLSTALLEEVEINSTRPEFRKATRLMQNCLGVSELCLSRLQPQLNDLLRTNRFENMCTIVGTSLGEIEVTRDFLVTLSQTGMARPILFQNSLHNAVNGFITMTLGLRGPSITVSQRFVTGENAIEAAQLLLAPQAPFALVVCGEIVVEGFLPAYRKHYPSGVELVDGASAMVLATEAAVKEYSLKPAIWLEEIRLGGHGVFMDSRYYDSDGLEKIIRALRKSETGLREVQLTKPNGSMSTTAFQRV